MLFVVMGFDRPSDGAEVRRANRAAHLRFLQEHVSTFRYGGALLGEGGKMVGSLMMLDLPDRAALRQFLEGEPYCLARLFEPLFVHETRQVAPEPAPGFIARELAGEMEKGLGA